MLALRAHINICCSRVVQGWECFEGREQMSEAIGGKVVNQLYLKTKIVY